MKHNLSAHFLWHIHVVMCCVTGAWACAVRDGMWVAPARKAQLGGGTLHITVQMYI